MIDNLYPESIEQSGKNLRLALQRISRHGLPYNPITYSVWYEYAAGQNQVLVDEINALEKDNDTVTLEPILKLFRQHLADSQVVLAQEKIKEFQTILVELSRVLIDSGGKLGDQGDALVAYARELGQTTSLQEVPTLARHIVSETRNMIKTGQNLKQQVASTASEVQTLKKELEGIRQKARTDMLTGLLNRRGFDEVLSKAMEASRKNESPLSIILADIDHFKKVNDTYGHLIGDNVLKMLSRLFNEHIKGKDTAARFGGEEFVLILPDTALKGAFSLSETIRKNLQEMKWVARGSGKDIGTITISMGVAQYRVDDTMEALIQRADKALYAAKNTGRNKTVTEVDISRA